ncbi:hypothetical protein [Nostoc sp. CCY0012]|uniref:hypothetical protein n=1 Tax=Nostoc sp. CCY0012 TaxID=1056123 RepID=UPI0039C6C4AE
MSSLPTQIAVVNWGTVATNQTSVDDHQPTEDAITTILQDMSAREELLRELG